MSGATTLMQTVLITLGITGVVGFSLVCVYRGNRLLFWCVAGAFFAHLLFAGSLWAVGAFMKEKEGERQIAVSIQAPVVEKKVEPPKIPEQTYKLDLPLGRPDGSRDVTKIKKGSTLDPNAREGAKGAKIFGNERTMASPSDGASGDVAYDPDAKGYDLYGPGDSMNPKDLYAVGKPGGGGDDWGIPEGDPDGGVPAGFAQGKVGGRVYFVRLKYGTSSAWIAYNEGTQRLLAYLNKSFPCQSETWPMSTAELRKKYLSKGALPSFLYVYCDDGFVLSAEEVLVLRDYMDKGGFLFLDSRPDQLTKDVVARQLDKVLPGLRLAALSSSHPINSFLYRLPAPGVGENILEKKNYGITRGGRLIVFYSMGNLCHFYAANEADAFEYATANYQMGANVMLYAITRGNPAGFQQKQGAKSAVTTQALEQMGFLSPETTEKPKEPGESVKIKPPPSTTPAGPGGTEEPTPDNPDEIKIF